MNTKQQQSSTPKLTEMQQFTIDFLKKQSGKKVNAGWLATVWMEHKHQTYKGASRDRFGFTSAAYRTLRKLTEMGLVISHNRDELFSIK